MARQQEHTPFVIPMEDPVLHTDTHPFCGDPVCPCHEDQELIMEVTQAVNQGLLTPAEATNLVNGKTL